MKHIINLRLLVGIACLLVGLTLTSTSYAGAAQSSLGVSVTVLAPPHHSLTNLSIKEISPQSVAVSASQSGITVSGAAAAAATISIQRRIAEFSSEEPLSVTAICLADGTFIPLYAMAFAQGLFATAIASVVIATIEF